MAKKTKMLGGDGIFEDILVGDTGVIPLLSNEEFDSLATETLSNVIPLLATRNIVVFPGVVVPLVVGREKSLKAIEHCYQNNILVGAMTQRNEEVEDPTENDLYAIGCLAKIIKVFSLPDNSKTVILQGVKPFELESLVKTEKRYLCGTVKPYPIDDFLPENKNDQQLQKTIDEIIRSMNNFVKLHMGSINGDIASTLNSLHNRLFAVNFVASNLPIDVSKKQALLEVSSVSLRAEMVLNEVLEALQLAQLKAQIRDKTKIEIDKQQKEYFLNQHLRTIQEELGIDNNDAITTLEEKAQKMKWDAKTKAHFEKEMHNFQRLNPSAPDYSVQLNYLELMVNLPWAKYSKDNLNLKNARKILDQDHFGLSKIKDRIVEYLAVLKLKGDMKSPILCFVGPPGVGKTSLGKSVARSMNREYIRMSLGGVRDESEIRGHRRTYIGAMPGRIIKNISKAGTSNPVFVLDEIDKLSGMTQQGDPSAAILEVLDPEQNTAFYDNYLDTPFDLSKVMFIATANTLSTIHPALIDRMEVIELNSYLLEEKINIAKRHLVPKQIKEHGMKAKDIVFSDEVIKTIITDYTRESGVRVLEKLLAKVIRNRACSIVNGDKFNKTVKVDELEKILGVPISNYSDFTKDDIGVAKGLAWTSVGGEVLFVETALSEGKGNLVLTGNLGDVMKESATIAFEYIKSHSTDWKISTEDFQNKDIYVHVPEGATPKDGPSAGITILTALLSTFTNTTIRSNTAMTGEITLRGKIGPVGGIKEKILAAKREHITTLVLPMGNRKDVEDIEKEYIEGLQFHYFDNMTQALYFNLPGIEQRIK